MPTDLFDATKDKIYREAAKVISRFDKDPYYLLQLFKGLEKLDNPYSRQKLMLGKILN